MLRMAVVAMSRRGRTQQLRVPLQRLGALTDSSAPEAKKGAHS
jgi:hypothetical protein